MTLTDQQAIRALLVSAGHAVKEAVNLVPDGYPAVEDNAAEAVDKILTALDALNKIEVYKKDG